MEQEPAWVPKARTLRAEGLSYDKIAARVKHDKATVYYWIGLSPEGRQDRRDKAADRARRLKDSPEGRARLDEYNRRHSIRLQARAEANETGEDYHAICRRWGL
jgi:transposase